MLQKIKQFFINAFNWIKDRIKKFLIALGFIGIAVAGGTTIDNSILSTAEMIAIKPELAQVEAWKSNKPTTDEQWKEDVKVESLNVKHDYQLRDMYESLNKKLPKVQADLDKFNTCPECIKFDLTQRFTQLFKDNGVKENGRLEGKTLQEWIDKEFNEELAYYNWKVGKIEQSMERILKEEDMRKTGKVDRKDEILGTTYYVDVVNGSDGNDGTATGTAWKTLDKFTENSRSAGDKVICRRNTVNNGTAATSTTSLASSSSVGVLNDLNFTSSGTMVSPIVIEADYDNSWNDFTLNAAVADLYNGSITIYFTSTTTTFSVGEWIYNSVDNNREYAYQIATSTPTYIQLYVPFKGTSGSAQTLNKMPINPQWGQTAGNVQWNFDADNYWKVQGLDVRGADPNGVIELDSSEGHEFLDMNIYQNNGSYSGISCRGEMCTFYVDKTYFNNAETRSDSTTAVLNGTIKNSYNLVIGTSAGTGGKITILDCIYGKTTGYPLSMSTTIGLSLTSYIRNLTIQYDSTPELTNNDNTIFNKTFVEDYLGGIGVNQQRSQLNPSENNAFLSSTSTTVRPGGGATSLELRPSGNIGNAWSFSLANLFEYPIYSDTSNKTYSMYFRPYATGTSGFGVSPTAAQLWIECEYYTATSGAFRIIKKSTGTIDASSTDWQALSVTCQPAQSGILYLRGWYGKTKETYGNILMMDVQPVISTP